MKEKETTWKQFETILAEEEESFRWGGDEDSEGTLSHGWVNFDRIRKVTKKLYNSTRQKVPVVSLQALKEYCEQNELRIERQELEENSYPIVFENRRLALLGDGDFVINKKDLLSWAEKEAKGQVLKK